MDRNCSTMIRKPSAGRFQDYIDALMEANAPIDDYVFEDGEDRSCG